MMKKQYSDMDKWVLAHTVGQMIPVVVIGLGMLIANVCGLVKKQDNAAVKAPHDKVQTARDTIAVVSPAAYLMRTDSLQRSR